MKKRLESEPVATVTLPVEVPSRFKPTSVNGPGRSSVAAKLWAPVAAKVKVVEVDERGKLLQLAGLLQVSLAELIQFCADAVRGAMPTAPAPAYRRRLNAAPENAARRTRTFPRDVRRCDRERGADLVDFGTVGATGIAVGPVPDLPELGPAHRRSAP